jgi:hypothetical protein
MQKFVLVLVGEGRRRVFHGAERGCDYFVGDTSSVPAMRLPVRLM